MTLSQSPNPAPKPVPGAAVSPTQPSGPGLNFDDQDAPMPVPANALRGLFWCIVIDLGLAGVIWALIVAWHYLPQICSLLFACLGWGPAIAAPLLIDNETRHI